MNLIFVFLAALAAFLPTSATALPRPIGDSIFSTQDFEYILWVGNASPYTMTELYIVHKPHHAESDSLGPNILQGDAIGPYEKIPLVRGGNGFICMYYFVAVFSNGRSYIQDQINMCATEGVLFEGNK